MRSGRSLLVLLAVALGLGAYIYFVEMKRDPDAATKKEKAFSVETGKIDNVELHAANGDVTTLKKQGDTWNVTAPVAAKADQSAVTSLVSTVETVEIEKVLDEHPASVSAYGLDHPRYSVTFRLPGDSAPHTLNVGSKTPTGSDVYAQIAGQPKLFLVAAYLDDSLNRTAFDLRDKTALAFSRDSVDTLTLEAPGSPALTVARKDADWRLTAPTAARADFATVDGAISKLSQLQIKSIVAGEGALPAPTPKEMATYGLEKPALVVTVGAGSTRASLALGTKKDDTSVYARDLSKPLVFTVDAATLTDLNKKADDLRVKDVFDFKPFSALSLDVSGKDTSATFAKSAAKPAAAPAAAPTAEPPADVWKETKPSAKDVNQTAMTDLLNTLSSLKALSFTDKALPSGEDLVVAVKYGEPDHPLEERVTLRKAGTVVQAIRASDTGAAVVPAADFDKAVSQLKALTVAK